MTEARADRPLSVWLVNCRRDDVVLWSRPTGSCMPEPHLELVIGIVFVGQRRAAVAERRLVEQALLICATTDWCRGARTAGDVCGISTSRASGHLGGPTSAADRTTIWRRARPC